MVQVDREEGYGAERYGTLSRFSSYYYQIRELLKTKPGSILEIGLGDGVTANYLKNHVGVAYTTADFAADLNPDIVADIRRLPVQDGSFDTVCAFEVLEHLPFEDFETGVRELSRVAKKYVIISLPHFGPPVQFLMKIPFVREIKFAFKIPFARTHVFNGQHYWEIGKRDYPASRIRTVLKKFGTIEREFVPFENQYHHFFIIKK